MVDEHVERLIAELQSKCPPIVESPWLEPGMKVLEIGTGSGWNAALIARGVGRDDLVHSVDVQLDLVERAREHLAEPSWFRSSCAALVRPCCTFGRTERPSPAGSAGRRVS